MSWVEHGRERSREALEASHTPAAIQARLGAGPPSSYVRDLVYGAVDGVVTTFAVVSGAAGAGLSSGIVIILGLSNLVADGLSMAASNFLGSRAEAELRERARRIEQRHVAQHPDGEREEIRQIFSAKGFYGADLDRVVDVITSDRDRWIETMLTEEMGLGATQLSPWRAGVSTFVAFVAAGALPLVVYVAELLGARPVGEPFLWSTLLAGVAFFAIGALKGRFVRRSAWTSGAETLLIGGAAAIAAYGIGWGLERLVGS